MSQALPPMMKLQNDILALVKNDQFNINQLILLLGNPLGTFVKSETFRANVTDVVNTIIKDRNGDKKFNMIDLELLCNDMMAVMSLVSSIILILTAIPDLDIQYQKGSSEELIFKVLLYIFLVILPNETSIHWTEAEKVQIVQHATTMYNMILASKVTQNLIKEIAKYFKSKGCTFCCVVQPNPDDVVADRLEPLKAQLSSTVEKNRAILRHIA